MVRFSSPGKWRTVAPCPSWILGSHTNLKVSSQKKCIRSRHTNHSVPFSSHHPISVKSGVIACLANCVIRVRSSQAGRDEELGRIQKVMMRNGYPRKFINKVVSSQIKRHTTSCVLKRQKQTTNEPCPITVSIPFVEGLSQEVRRIARTTGFRCAFFTPNTYAVFSLYIEGPTSNRFDHQCRVLREMQNVLW